MKSTILAILLLAGVLYAGAQTVTVSGRVTDEQNGKPLTNAHVRVDRYRQITDSQGAFALQLPAREGTCEVEVSYVGYVPQKFVVSTLRDTVIFVSLKPGYRLPDVQVYAPRHDFGVEHVQMSAVELPMTQVRSLPALFGETDVMKALQRLPGVQEAGDGKAGIHVRGGNYDENLITVDGATLYNAEHLDGFVSALNADMVDNVVFYKGAFPARYGSRLSSVVDVGMREGDYQDYHGSLTAGMLAARVQVEGPIRRGSTSFNVGIRASYFDAIVQPLLEKVYDKPESLQPYADMNYYDINAKLVHRFSEQDKLSATFYWGKDVNNSAPTDSRQQYADGWSGGEDGKPMQRTQYDNTRSNYTDNTWGNIVSSLYWTHKKDEALSMNTNLSYSRYRYRLETGADIENRSDLETQDNESAPIASNLQDLYREHSYSIYHSGIDETALTTDFRYAPPASGHDVRWGARLSWQHFTPTVDVYKESYHKYLNENGTYQEDESLTDATRGKERDLCTLALYAEDDWTFSERWRVNAGLRYMPVFTQGKTYHSIEPRLSLRWLFHTGMSLKASYSRMAQAVHLLSSSNLVMPSDLWVPVTVDIPLMRSDQWALGYNWQVAEGLDLSVEGYYKLMHNVIDYREGASYMNDVEDWEEMVAVGRGRSYGAELMLRKTTGKTTGWVAYTWAKSLRQYDQPGQEIASGRKFYANNDCRNHVSIVLMHHFNKHWEVSATWMYRTGRRGILATTALHGGWLDEYDPYGSLFSSDSSQQGDGHDGVPDGPAYFRRYPRLYSYRERNGYRLPATHRLDVAVNYRVAHDTGESHISLSICNLYNRQNVSDIYIGYDDNRTVLKGVCMFPFMPSLSYMFKF